MLGIIPVLLVLWATKKHLTQTAMICVCAAGAYLFAYLEALGGDAHGQQLIDMTVLWGTLNLAVFYLISLAIIGPFTAGVGSTSLIPKSRRGMSPTVSAASFNRQALATPSTLICVTGFEFGDNHT